MGVSTGNVNGTFAGTLGVRVFRIGKSSAVGYITNNHVAAASGPSLCPAQPNPVEMPAFGVDQCQPGLLDDPSPTVQAPAVNLQVRKSGRMTGLTTGTIQTINATVNVSYGRCGVAKFIGQILITPWAFSAAGDSGSLILGGTDGSGRRKPVGLLFAGSSTITVANRISDVLGALHSQIDTK